MASPRIRQSRFRNEFKFALSTLSKGNGAEPPTFVFTKAVHANKKLFSTRQLLHCFGTEKIGSQERKMAINKTSALENSLVLLCFRAEPLRIFAPSSDPADQENTFFQPTLKVLEITT